MAHPTDLERPGDQLQALIENELQMIPFSQLRLPRHKMRAVDPIFVSELSSKAFDASTTFLVLPGPDGTCYEVHDGTHRYLAFADKLPSVWVRCTVLKASSTEAQRFAFARQRNHVAHCVRLNHLCDHLQGFSFFASVAIQDLAIQDSPEVQRKHETGKLTMHALNTHLGKPSTLAKYHLLLDEQVHPRREKDTTEAMSFQRWLQLCDLLVGLKMEFMVDDHVEDTYSFNDFILVNTCFPKLTLTNLMEALSSSDESRKAKTDDEKHKIRFAMHLFAQLIHKRMDPKSASAAANVKNQTHKMLFNGLMHLCLASVSLDELLASFDAKMGTSGTSSMVIDLCQDDGDDVTQQAVVVYGGPPIPSGLVSLLGMFASKPETPLPSLKRTAAKAKIPLAIPETNPPPKNAKVKVDKRKKKKRKRGAIVKPNRANKLDNNAKDDDSSAERLRLFEIARDAQVVEEKSIVSKLNRVFAWALIECITDYDFIKDDGHLHGVVVETMVDSLYAHMNPGFTLSEAKIDAFIQRHRIH